VVDMVSACKGVVEHRGKLWGELTEGEGNIVASRVGSRPRPYPQPSFIRL